MKQNNHLFQSQFEQQLVMNLTRETKLLQQSYSRLADSAAWDQRQCEELIKQDSKDLVAYFQLA